jgi:hypothetical protein
MTCVPPMILSQLFFSALKRIGKSVCATSVTEPAVPMSNSYFPPMIGPGSNESKADPSSAPWSAPLQTFLTALHAVRCCGWSPGFGRLARMFVMRTGFRVIAERVSDVRMICPPPSPCAPSISIMRKPRGEGGPCQQACNRLRHKNRLFQSLDSPYAPLMLNARFFPLEESDSFPSWIMISQKLIVKREEN